MKSGYVAITGKPNVGKSTFLNTILNKKVAITSPKPQTTRNQIHALFNYGDDKIQFVDTPG
jgi:GTP-binding protein Era